MIAENEITKYTLDSKTAVGKVTLGVANLEMMTDFYTELIGLTVQDQGASVVELGVDDIPLLRLEARPNGRQYPNATGLYHFALLLPSREELGQWLTHLSANNYSLTGASDHLVSEALYLNDPEGNGTEVYRDRPRSEWHYESGQIQMATIRLNLQALLADAKPAPFTQLPSGTIMGHIHLQVNDVTKNAQFYADLVGFESMLLWPEAAFLAAGGYHHHLGMNIWHSRGASSASEGSLGLLRYEIRLPDAQQTDSLVARLDAMDVPIIHTDEGPSIMDPSGNLAVLTAQ
ncbi:MAG: VOC family protein [Chloroflexota bacterium]